MSKKILDAAVTVIFCTCLIVTSNIQETDTEKQNADALQRTELTDTAYQSSTSEENSSVRAGVCRVLFQHSFTTESDEVTGIEIKQKVIVASPEETQEVMPLEVQTESVPVEVQTDYLQQDTAGQTICNEETENQIYQNRWNITLTEEEIELLARIVWLEANGEPVEGQEAVVEVILNRMASDLYPDTLYDVLSQKHPVQFCSFKNRERATPTEKEYQSIYEVLNGNTNILRNDTLYFSTVALTSNLDVRIGGHSFCY